MKIKALNSNVKGMKLIVPFDGLIEINAEGIADVSEKAAKALVNGTNDWKYFEVEKTPKAPEKKEANNIEKKEEAAAEEKTEEAVEEKNEDEVVFEGIKKMKLEDMLKMAQEAGYPEEEYSRFTKKEKLMAAYLIKKYNEAKLDGEENAE